jgi:chaperone required for assembly of F1-ATPase
VQLDGRLVKTPAKAPLIVPTLAMADAIAGEWDAQDDAINPETMPFTRSANAAIDKVANQHAEVAEMLADYGDSDLLCYRADAPQELVVRQASEWDPVLDWAEQTLGARLHPRRGLSHQAHDQAALLQLRQAVHDLSNYQLAAFHDLVSMSGSLVLGFAAAHNWRDADDIWRISRLDESWQEEHWGVDDEARETAELKRRAFLHAKSFYDFS